ncbi:MAG TPA: high-potential iron-sulfur protein [Gammaproteobacteria bacterium]|nr:high-potential iron-sulfur protein [Gammaproteobacteria bacterium]
MTDSNDSTNVDRRAALKRLLGIGIAAAAAPALLLGTNKAQADDKCQGSTPKQALNYQEKPNGKQMCSNCMHFCPGSSAKAMGTCKVVKGPISPDGWCAAWAAKS